jgi:predicted PhzF superfamily epimerase YddE/YHI9
MHTEIRPVGRSNGVSSARGWARVELRHRANGVAYIAIAISFDCLSRSTALAKQYSSRTCMRMDGDMEKIEARVMRVFTNKELEFGNHVGIVFDEERALSDKNRQEIAVKLGYSESVFVNDLQAGHISTYTPQREIPFAGHAAVGAAWLLGIVRGTEVQSLQGPEGHIRTWTDDHATWVRSELKSTPPWWHERLPDAAAIEALTGPQDSAQEHTQLWAWLDETAGRIRSRTFASAWGIPEDEANGSGCMRLAAALGRRIEVIHGKGSVIFAKPGIPGWADVGGRVVEDALRTVEYD